MSRTQEEGGERASLACGAEPEVYCYYQCHYYYYYYYYYYDDDDYYYLFIYLFILLLLPLQRVGPGRPPRALHVVSNAYDTRYTTTTTTTTNNNDTTTNTTDNIMMPMLQCPLGHIYVCILQYIIILYIRLSYISKTRPNQASCTRHVVMVHQAQAFIRRYTQVTGTNNSLRNTRWSFYRG